MVAKQKLALWKQLYVSLIKQKKGELMVTDWINSPQISETHKVQQRNQNTHNVSFHCKWETKRIWGLHFFPK